MSELFTVLEEAFRFAMSQYTGAQNVVRPTTHNRPPRSFWPGEVSVSTLAWVQASCADPQTRLCALGVGAQYDRPASVSMQEGTYAHSVILPLAAMYLAQQGIACSHEHRFGGQGIRGVVDLLIPNSCIVELKTSNASAGRSPQPTQYELYQVALYAWGLNLPVVIAVAYLDTKAITLHHVDNTAIQSHQADVLVTLRAYMDMAARRPSPPVGQCALCTYKQDCGSKSGIPACVTCQRPLVQELIFMVSDNIGVHTCGQAVRVKKDGGIECVRVSGSRLVAKTS